jgi:hypothetical protein
MLGFASEALVAFDCRSGLVCEKAMQERRMRKVISRTKRTAKDALLRTFCRPMQIISGKIETIHTW